MHSNAAVIDSDIYRDIFSTSAMREAWSDRSRFSFRIIKSTEPVDDCRAFFALLFLGEHLAHPSTGDGQTFHLLSEDLRPTGWIDPHRWGTLANGLPSHHSGYAKEVTQWLLHDLF
jgi:hypothetical protein